MARRLSPPTLLSTTSNTIAVSSSRLHLVRSKYYVYTWRQWEVKVWCLFPQSIMRMRTHLRGTTDTEKSPKHGRCVWETLRNQLQKVRNCGATYRSVILHVRILLKSVLRVKTWFKLISGFSLYSILPTQPPQTPQQWKGHRWLPLWEVQEDESKILKSWMFVYGWFFLKCPSL